MDELEKQLNDFEINDADLIDDIEDDLTDDIENDINSRYCKPAKQKHIAKKVIKFENAQKLVRKIDMQSKDSVYAIVDGKFVFGEFILAFLHHHDIKAKRMDISTLSLSYQNILGLEVFMKKGYIENLNFLIGYYFYAHERNGLVKKMYEHLNRDNNLQIAVCRNHTKQVIIETERGTKIVFHGSANLRSSDNMEQLQISFDSELHDFIKDFNDSVIEKYYTIKKPLTNNQIKNL